MLEKDIEDKVCRYATTKYNMLAEKYTSPNRRSVPDRLFSAYNGSVFFAEFKAPGKKPTTKQLRDHARRRVLGHRVYVIDDIEQGKKVIDYEAVFAALSVPAKSYPVQPGAPAGDAVVGHGPRQDRRRVVGRR